MALVSHNISKGGGSEGLGFSRAGRVLDVTAKLP